MLSNCSALHINFKYRFSRDSALNAVHFQVLSLIFIFILCMSRYLFQFLDIVSSFSFRHKFLNTLKNIDIEINVLLLLLFNNF